MATGKVKALVRDRGFGFIAPSQGGDDLFFHSSAMEAGLFDSIQLEQALEFDVEQDSRNPGRQRAVNVRLQG
jgi:CspA family cold shock protein